MLSQRALDDAAEMIRRASSLLIGAGAGMGVDSGLPDFRGDQGFWNAYPPYARRGLRFVEMANPEHFVRDAPFAWGFYGHRRGLYRATTPHEGFAVLRRMADRMSNGAFVYTSNVDGQFQRSGFDDSRIVECHGSIEFEQCMEACGQDLWRAVERITVDVEMSSMRACGALPVCPACDGLARPNILMFGDAGWDPSRTGAQERRLAAWARAQSPSQAVVIEVGAGTAVPSVRMACERWASAGADFIRINPREAEVPTGCVSLAGGAAETLMALEERLSG